MATLAHFFVAGVFIAGIQLYVVTDLGESEGAVGAAVAAFSVAAIVFRPSVGRGMDRRGRRPFLLGSLVLLTASSAAFALVDTLPWILVLRFLQGAAGAGFYTTGAAIVLDLAPVERRAAAISRFSLFLYAGLALGPVTAEAVARTAGFDALWLLTAAAAGLGLLVVLRLPETGAPLPPGHPRERFRVLHPLAVGPGVVLLMAATGYAAVVGFSALYAAEIGMATSGLLYGTFAATIIGVRIAAGGLADRFGPLRVSMPALALGAAGLGLMAGGRQPILAVLGVAGFGAAFALLFPALLSAVAARVPDSQRGEAVASFTAFMDLGVGAGGFGVGVLAERASYGMAYGFAAILCLLGIPLLWRQRVPTPTRR